MSRQHLNLNSHSYVIKRNYNQMLENSIDNSLNNESFIKNQLFKSALKFGGPINQDVVIHHKKNVRKSMGYKIEQTNTNADGVSYEKKQNEKNINSKEKEEINKNEEKIDLSNSPKEKKNNFQEKNNIFNNDNNNCNNNHLQFCNFFSARKEDNNNKNKYFKFNTERRITTYDNSPLNENIKKEIKNDLLINNSIVQKSETKKEEKNENEIKEKNSNENNKIINNPFLQNNFIQNKNDSINPFHSSKNSFFITSNDNQQIKDNNINNIVENPFLAISKPKIENPFKITNPFISNNPNNDNNTIMNSSDITNNNKIINPFTSSNNNPFSNISSNQNNPNNQNNNQVINPFIQNNSYNPFLPNAKDNNDNNINNNKELNPFSFNTNNSKSNNVVNPFTNSNNTNTNTINPFINSNNSNTNAINPFSNSNNTNTMNPFINSNDNNNPFISNPFNTQNKCQILNQYNNNNEKEEELDDNYNVEEEIKIEKNEEALKQFKEVKYAINNKFYEVEIENLQYLGKENDKNKYFTIGPGMLSLEEDKDENGKKRGIFVLRDLTVKNVKIQGIILSTSIVEKVKLKNGIEIILFKNVFATFPKYNKDNISYETKLTYIRMRVKPENLDILYKKANEFFEFLKK